MANGRCRLHGGKSTGLITCEGLERSQRANFKHRHFSAEAQAQRTKARAELRPLRDLMAELMVTGGW